MRFTYRDHVLGASYLIPVLKVLFVLALPQTTGCTFAVWDLRGHVTRVSVIKAGMSDALLGDQLELDLSIQEQDQVGSVQHSCALGSHHFAHVNHDES